MIEKLLSSASIQIEAAIGKCKTEDRIVIARYAAAIMVNFTDWLGKTLPWVRHEKARYVVTDNLRCESVEDHVGMLDRFASLSGVIPDQMDYIHSQEDVATIRSLFTNPQTAGLSGVALCATLETLSMVFIPDLENRAKLCRCTDLTYTHKHGVADKEHSKAFILATLAEADMGYDNPQYQIGEAVNAGTNLIAKIWE